MTIRKRFVAVALAGAVVGSGMITTAAGAATRGEVVAQSCYGDANTYTKDTGTNWYPNYPNFHRLITTSSCADINIKTNTDRYVKVCFLPRDGGRDCQDNYKLAKKGTWTVIATDVKDNTSFQFYFRSDAKSTGSYAA
ncbi:MULTISPECIES: hypothetical protein [Streptomyces]|uniref:Secreted protein n=1 Tax=Streptomyces africanus TaxID=231024 RepID=A0ABU0QUT3_9ACTN|nr:MULTISPECIES: hypothetical protein [Streptomyces]MDQ0750760.1 hypothetical protein [Streptomyces africanus]MDQ1016888.1 hypothetical protein [Streptomyces afghaniensis]